MKDKPIPAKIILSLKNSKSNFVNFIGLSTTLYHQNLIFLEPRELRKEKNVLELIVIFQDIKSLKTWLTNDQIKEQWSEIFKNQLIENPKTIKQTDVIIEVDKVENCNCQKSDYYIFQGRSILPYDELVCNKCFGMIPYSRIPLEIKIEGWQLHYQRVYYNWLESSIFEKQAYKELINYKKGKLNIAGEIIRNQLSSFFKIPVYIKYFDYQLDDNHTCLICNSEGEKNELSYPTRICKKCNTIF